ncbi:MAG TPA: PIN domain-containing protein [Bryobacteraceae bacterium]|jgi:predicted nucleic acid-binding protein
MSVEFVDTNLLVYAHDSGAGLKYQRSVELLTRLFETSSVALSTQVLAEFYAVATKKLAMKSEEAEEIIRDLRGTIIHQPSPADVLRACHLHRRYKIGWWDALILNSAAELDCTVLWSDDFNHGQRYGTVMARNPFK